MHFLINESDNSVNCVSSEPFPEFMLHAGLLVKELPVDHLPEDTNLYHCFYDTELNTIILDPRGVKITLTNQEIQDMIAQREQIEQTISLSKQDVMKQLVQRMAELHPEDPVFASILADNVVSSDELKQIEDMLNGVK